MNKPQQQESWEDRFEQYKGSLAESGYYGRNNPNNFEKHSVDGSWETIKAFISTERQRVLDEVRKYAENSFRLVEPAMLVPIVDDNGTETGRKIDRFKGTWLSYEDLLSALEEVGEE